MPEQLVEIEFVHHYTDKRGETPVAYVPGGRGSFAGDVADQLVRSKIATRATAPAPIVDQAPELDQAVELDAADAPAE